MQLLKDKEDNQKQIQDIHQALLGSHGQGGLLQSLLDNNSHKALLAQTMAEVQHSVIGLQQTMERHIEKQETILSNIVDTLQKTYQIKRPGMNEDALDKSATSSSSSFTATGLDEMAGATKSAR